MLLAGNHRLISSQSFVQMHKLMLTKNCSNFCISKLKFIYIKFTMSIQTKLKQKPNLTVLDIEKEANGTQCNYTELVGDRQAVQADHNYDSGDSEMRMSKSKTNKMLNKYHQQKPKPNSIFRPNEPTYLPDEKWQKLKEKLVQEVKDPKTKIQDSKRSE